MKHVSLVWPKTKEYTTVVGRDDLFYNIDRRYVMQLWKWFEYFFRLTKVNRKNFTKGYQLRSTNMFTVIFIFQKHQGFGSTFCELYNLGHTAGVDAQIRFFAWSNLYFAWSFILLIKWECSQTSVWKVYEPKITHVRTRT